MIEKRFAKRIPSSRPVLLLFDNRTIYAIMTDFSRHGIGLISDEALPKDKRIEVHFDIPNQNALRPFQFKAEVKHCISWHSGNHIGIRLDFPSQSYLELYEHLAVA